MLAFPLFALLLAAVDVKLPPPFHTPSATNRPRVIPRPEGARLEVPAGFKVDVYAEGFGKPRFMLLGPGREILLSDSLPGDAGSVYVLRDNGKQRKKLIGGLDRPYGLALRNGYLYVGEPERVSRYRYNSKALSAGVREEVVSYAGFGKGHWTRSLVFDPEGKKLYIGVGSESNVSTGEDPRRAAINRCNPDGSEHEIYASGLRNTIGMRFHPATGVLWAAVQERDGLGDDLAPDYFTSVRQGGFYGWPFAYIGPHEEPRNKGANPGLVAKTIVPDVPLGAHVAVLDFIFYTGRQFPAEYQGGAFLAYHGSWNRSKRVGQSVVYVPFKNGAPAGDPRDFLTGWMLSPDQQEVWGRPVGLLEMPDGSLLISEDGNNKLWRISYTR